MPQAENRLHSRAEIRNILRTLGNNVARRIVFHRDAFRNDSKHDEQTCKICIRMKGEIEALEDARRHFGGR